MGEAMKAGLAVLIIVVMSRPDLARSQSDLDEVRTIPIHPAVTTMLQLPDDVVDTWLTDRGAIRVASKGNEVAIRPRAGTRAGVEASLEVKTGTIYRTFRLRVVARAKDASRDVLVLAANAEHDTGEPAPETPPVAPAEPMAPVMCAEPAASVVPPVSISASEPGAMAPAVPVAPAEPVAPAAGSTEPSGQVSIVAADSKRDTAAGRSPRFDLSVQALFAVGTTALHVEGYQSINARQPHQAIGGRVAIHPRGTPWAVEGSISGEFPATPTTHTRADDRGEKVLEADGPRLRADVVLSGMFGRTMMPTFRVGIGLQAHHLNIEARDEPRSNEHGSDLPYEGVLVLGMGLAYRTGDVLLGLELHVRQGVLTGYRSVSGILSAGFFLDQGD